MEYTVFDSCTFCTGQERALQLLYGESAEADTLTGPTLQTAASRLLSLLLALKVPAPDELCIRKCTLRLLRMTSINNLTKMRVMLYERSVSA